MQRYAIFVDGSNLFGDLLRLNVRVTNHGRFFTHIFEQAVECTRSALIGAASTSCLVRTLWYQLGSIDEWDLSDSKSIENLRQIFERMKDVKDHYLRIVGPTHQDLKSPELLGVAFDECLGEARVWYDKKVSRISGLRRFHHSMQAENDFLEIVDCGHWKVDMLRRSVEEKRLDTTMAVDMVTLSDIFDVAVVISGDADAIPAICHVKRRGKAVGVVEFLKGHPPEKRSRQSSSKLKNHADFVVHVYETDLTRKGFAEALKAGESDLPDSG